MTSLSQNDSKIVNRKLASSSVLSVHTTSIQECISLQIQYRLGSLNYVNIHFIFPHLSHYVVLVVSSLSHGTWLYILTINCKFKLACLFYSISLILIYHFDRNSSIYPFPILLALKCSASLAGTRW